MLQNKIVAHFQDGHLLKGSTTDFFPNKDVFHISPAEAPPGTKPVEVLVSDLKAVFFVKDFTGFPGRERVQEIDPSQRVVGRKIRVRFKDGEELLGTTQGYQPGRPGFFVIPTDPESNNERCYVVASAAEEVSFV